MAAGLGLLEQNIKSFTKAINLDASKLNPLDFVAKEQLIGMLNTGDIDLELLDLLERFEPYGEANKRPTFFMKNAKVVSIKLMGKDRSHSRIKIKQYPHDRDTLELIAFRTVFEMPHDGSITCSYGVSKNEFNNKVSVQLIVNKIYL